MRFFQADGGEEIGSAEVVQVDFCALNSAGTLMKATALDVEVFHQNHPGEEILCGRQVERLGDLAEGFEQGVLAFQAIGGFRCACFDSHFQLGIDSRAMFFDETFHSASQVLNTLGLQDQGRVTQLGDYAC